MRPMVSEPPEDLSRFIEYFWTLERDEDDAVLTLKAFATGVSGIIFQHDNGRSAWGAPTAQTEPSSIANLPTSFVYGKRTQPAETFARGRFGLTGAVFKPQALGMLLDVAPAELTNAPVELDELSEDHLGERLLDARGHAERVALLVGFFRTRMDGARPEDALVAASLREIHRNVRTIRVAHLLKALHVSERQFDRRFTRTMGVSPHRYIRIARFQEALRLLKTRQFERLSGVAYDLNYADQSHFIKDVKAFSGYTPTSLSEAARAAVDLPCCWILPRGECWRTSP